MGLLSFFAVWRRRWFLSAVWRIATLELQGNPDAQLTPACALTEAHEWVIENADALCDWRKLGASPREAFLAVAEENGDLE